jgi:hypothetical protein
MPTLDQILFWDRRIIPVAKWIDRFIGYSFEDLCWVSGQKREDKV